MIKIREIDYNSSKTDKAAFIKAYLNIFNSSENLKYLSFTGIPFTQVMVANWVESLCEESEIRYRIAIFKEQIVGVSVLKMNPLLGFELLGLAVHPDFKKQGIGTKLLNDCISYFIEYTSIDAIVFADNKPMLILLIKNGFKPVAMKNDYRFDGVNTLLLKRNKNNDT